jgi:hypothetical protein
MMKKLITGLASIPVDKWMHAVVSVLITVFLYKLFALTGMPLTMTLIISSVLTAGIGIAKEVWDKKNNGSPEARDVVADIIGVVVGILLVLWILL